MQPEAQTATRGSLAVSAGALEISELYSRRLRSVITLLLPFICSVSRKMKEESPAMHPSISSPNLVSTLLLPLVVFGMLAIV